MQPSPETPKRMRSAGHRGTSPESGHPSKKRKYVPGGPGGGGRYVQDEGRLAMLEREASSTGIASTGLRGRVGRLNTENAAAAVTPSLPSYPRPRRDRPPAGPRSSSAAAAAAAVAQSNDGYKPREERGWEEFHQDLDIEADVPVFTADQVDGVSPPDTESATPTGTGHVLSNGTTPKLEAQASAQAEDASNAAGELVNGAFATPGKRKAGRPPRRLDAMLSGLGSPPAPRINPLPTHNPKEKLNLPKPSYRQVDPFAAFEQDHSVQVNYVDRAMANLGYQESDVFITPEKTLIRAAEGSIEEDLDLAMQIDVDGSTGAVPIGRVEYDMDEQDDRWLEQLNAQRKEESAEAIKPAIFEVTVTQIEKEWHALEKRIPKPNPKPPQTHRPRSSSAAAVNGEPAGQGEEQDTKCAICDDGDCENTNAIVFCDGCDLAVHQECYGVPFIPEGQWLCRRCQLIGRMIPASDHPGCIFCPNTEGAFKQTVNQKWAHLLCAMWIPEVTLANTTFQEPVTDVEKVPKTRWRLTCYICKQRMGACVQCAHKSCFEAFHVTCARRARLCLKMKSAQNANTLDVSRLKAYCDRHAPPEWRRENDVERATEEAKTHYRDTLRNVRWGDSQALALSASSYLAHTTDGADDLAGEGNKRRQSHGVRSWRLPSGAPVVPQVVLRNVETALVKFGIRRRKEFVQEACKYWTLKREARRGAALLKRLQLQMEAFSSMEITRRNWAGMGAAGRPRLQRRIEFAAQLQRDMEQLRVLCSHIKEREAFKLRDVDILKTIVDVVYFPIPPLLQPILEKAQNLDTKNLFSKGFQSLQAKLDEKLYSSVTPFSADLAAVFSSVIEFTTITDARDAEHQLSEVEHSSLTAEQKEKKKLAKRIVKVIQPLLEDATKKEAELAGKPFEKDLPNLEALLDQKLVSQSAGLASCGTMSHEALTVAAKEGRVNGHMLATSTNAKAEATQLAPTPDASGGFETANDGDAAVDVAMAAPIVRGPSARGVVAEPLTPPRSEKDLLAPLANGGIPWYMEPFDPDGTTVHEERWTGRQVLRDMTEELSELDDAELDGLAEPGEAAPADEPASAVPSVEKRASVEKAPRPAPPARKRRRRW